MKMIKALYTSARMSQPAEIIKRAATRKSNLDEEWVVFTGWKAGGSVA
jgi:hypothetical protein